MTRVNQEVDAPTGKKPKDLGRCQALRGGGDGFVRCANRATRTYYDWKSCTGCHGNAVFSSEFIGAPDDKEAV